MNNVRPGFRFYESHNTDFNIGDICCSKYATLTECLLVARPIHLFDDDIAHVPELPGAPRGGGDRGNATHSDSPAA
eukprot:7984340-Pyramimonas_sp.AAC.1